VNTDPKEVGKRDLDGTNLFTKKKATKVPVIKNTGEGSTASESRNAVGESQMGPRKGNSRGKSPSYRLRKVRDQGTKAPESSHALEIGRGGES